MLAQNFKTAKELKISDVEYGGLVTVLGMLERGECDGFSMHDVTHRCGTPSCILGWARYATADGRLFRDNSLDASALNRLFFPDSYGGKRAKPAIDCKDQSAAARALRSYLTIGEANWPEALAAV